jgi:hypothetical protein
MDTNPYEPPKQPGVTPQGSTWKWVCLMGLAAMAASAGMLFGTAEFRHGTVIYRHAAIAVLFAGVFGCGAIAFIGGGLGWLIARLRTGRQQ